MSTLRDKYLEQLQTNYEEALDLSYTKSQDYATDGDPFKNFRNAPIFAGTSLEKGILVRVGDKLARYLNLLEKNEFEGATGENITDTLRDAMNYLNILLTWVQLGKPEPDANFVEQEVLTLEFLDTQLDEKNTFESMKDTSDSYGISSGPVTVSGTVSEKAPKDWIERLTGRAPSR